MSMSRPFVECEPVLHLRDVVVGVWFLTACVSEHDVVRWLFATLDHIASNWQLPIGGFFITLAAGWFMTRKSTEEELADETAPGWFRYGAWRFFIRYIAPLAVASIIAAVIFFHADFS